MDHHEYVPDNVDLEQHAHLQDVCDILEFPLSPMGETDGDEQQGTDNIMNHEQERLYTVRRSRGAGDNEDVYSPLRPPEDNMGGTDSTPLQSNGNSTRYGA